MKLKKDPIGIVKIKLNQSLKKKKKQIYYCKSRKHRHYFKTN